MENVVLFVLERFDAFRNSWLIKEWKKHDWSYFQTVSFSREVKHLTEAIAFFQQTCFPMSGQEDCESTLNISGKNCALLFFVNLMKGSGAHKWIKDGMVRKPLLLITLNTYCTLFRTCSVFSLSMTLKCIHATCKTHSSTEYSFDNIIYFSGEINYLRKCYVDTDGKYACSIEKNVRVYWSWGIILQRQISPTGAELFLGGRGVVKCKSHIHII